MSVLNHPTKLKRFLYKVVGNNVVSDQKKEYMKPLLKEAIRTAKTYNQIPKQVHMNIVEGSVLASIYVEEYLADIDTDKQKGDIDWQYVKELLLYQYSAFNVLAGFYIREYSPTHMGVEVAREMLGALLMRFHENPSIARWNLHREIFSKNKAMPYLGELFVNSSFDISSMAKKLPINEVTLASSKIIENVVMSLYHGQELTLEEKIDKLPVIFGNSEKHRKFIKILPDCISPMLENLSNINDEKVRRLLRRFVIDRMGNPRIVDIKREPWSRVSHKGRQEFMKMLAQDDLDFFFEVASKIDYEDMWTRRKAFWEQYVPYMSDTKAFFNIGRGPSVARWVQEYCQRNDLDELRYGKVRSSDSKCAFMFRIKDTLIIEWTSNGKVTILPYPYDGERLIMKNYWQEKELKDYLRDVAPWQWPHSGEAWKRRVMNRIQKETHVEV